MSDEIDDQVVPDVTLCGNTERLGDGSPALQLPTNRPLVFVQDALPGFSQDVIWEWLRLAYGRWTAVCNLEPERVMSPSAAVGSGRVLHFVTVADLGGGGVLADQQLPFPGATALRMRINRRVKWVPTDGPMQGGIDPVRTLCHEIGHFLGMSHFPVGAPPDLMEPTVSQTIISPQPPESKLAAGWFGPPLPTSPPPPPPTVEPVLLRFSRPITELLLTPKA